MDHSNFDAALKIKRQAQKNISGHRYGHYAMQRYWDGVNTADNMVQIETTPMDEFQALLDAENERKAQPVTTFEL